MLSLTKVIPIYRDDDPNDFSNYKSTSGVPSWKLSQFCTSQQFESIQHYILLSKLFNWFSRPSASAFKNVLDQQNPIRIFNCVILYSQKGILNCLFSSLETRNKPGTAQVGAISKARIDPKTETTSTTGDNKSSQKTKNWKKIPNFFSKFFEVSGKSHSAEKCKRGRFGILWTSILLQKYQKLMAGTI